MFEKFTAQKILKLLEKVEHGTLSLTTPDGEKHYFAGQLKGPKADITIDKWSVITRLPYKGDIGFAEDYKNGHWETDDIRALMDFAVMNAKRLEGIFFSGKFMSALTRFLYALRPNSVSGSRKNIHAHYDLGNAFYELWLDPSMTYSSALFETDKQNLLVAQNNKYDRIASLLSEKSGRLLEIGCGWGGFAERASTQGDFEIKGLTISDEQYKYAVARNVEHKNVTIAHQDYRHEEGQYDHIVSIEMFEAVGQKYWKTYFDQVAHNLKSKGKAVIQTITIGDTDFEKYKNSGDFIRSFIFPGGLLPSPELFRKYAEHAGLRVGGVFPFGQDYARTLDRWLSNFDAQIDKIKELGFDEPFIRIWRMYLASCMAEFKSGRTDVMQFELSHAR